MKKLLSGLIVLALIVMSGFVILPKQNAVALTNAETIIIKFQIGSPYMYVNGEKKEIDPGRGTVPVIVKKWGRTVLPARAIVENLGGIIGWDGEERKVTIDFKTTEILLWIDKPKAKVNGVEKWIDPDNHDVRPIIINGRTMLPIRFVGENMGCLVGWDGKTRTVSLTYTVPPKVKIGLVTDVGGRGDKSFNDSALRGLENWAAGVKMIAGEGYKPLSHEEYMKIIKEEAPDLLDKRIHKFDIQPMVLESKANEDYVPNLKRLADEGCKLVIGVGFMLTDAIKEVAPLYPDTYFMLIDGVIENPPPNVVCYTFKENEGSFLVGALAGQMTKKDKVGFVGGMDLFIIHKFEYGYKAGVKTVNPDCEVLVGYTGNFTNADDGQKIAKQQFDAGADIVYHASGACGLGVIKEAQARGEGYYAIGVDSDQDYLAPGRVLTSMIKHVDYAVWLSIESVLKGTFKPGIVSLGVKEGGVGLSPMKYTKDKIPPEVLEKVEKLRKMIADGVFKVPATEEEFNNFVPPQIP